MWLFAYAASFFQSPEGEMRSPTVIVEARSNRPSLDGALKACLERGCEPDDLANRALASANAAFVAGDYTAARSTLAKASRRLVALKAPPRALAAVFRAEATVVEHQGDAKDAAGLGRRAIFALSRGGANLRGEEISTRLQLGDFLVRNGRTSEGREVYRFAAAVADKAGLADYRAAVELHIAYLDYKIDGGQEAPRRLQALATTADPAIPAAIRTAAALLLARIGREHGDMAPTEALLERIAKQRTETGPLLLVAPPLYATLPPTRDPFEFEQPISVAAEQTNQGLEWVDVGYWIRPSGLVDDVEVLRGSRGRYWVAPAVKALLKRVYAPMPDTSTEGVYKVVRLTLGHEATSVNDSFIKKRAGPPVINELDLANTDRPAASTLR